MKVQMVMLMMPNPVPRPDSRGAPRAGGRECQ
jgi:hypothetical protein